MRALFAPCLALALAAWLATAGCEGVPDLRFADSPDGGPTATLPDATVATEEASAGRSLEDATVGASPEASTSDDDATGPSLPQDATTPPPSDGAPPATTGCPGAPPPGATCCGTVACKGNAQQCNCSLCGYCANEGFCCPSNKPPPAPPGYCATTLKGCN